MLPAGLLALALLAPAAPPDPVRLPKGAELIYTGTVAEAVDRPGRRFRREHDLEIRLFVLDQRDGWADVAVLTLLRRAGDPATAAALPVVTGASPDRPADPPAARLDLVRVAADGSARLLRPAGPVPLRLAADTPTAPLPPPPPDTFAPFEFGMLPPAAGDGWEPGGDEFVNGEQCRRLLRTRRTPDWDRPRAGQTAWRRVDGVWLSADGLARRVEREVSQKDEAGAAVAARVAVRYELKQQARLRGRDYDRYRREIEVGYAAAADLPAIAREGTPAREFDIRLARLNRYLAETDAATPYREAVLAVRRQLEAARRGEFAPAPSSGGREPPVWSHRQDAGVTEEAVGSRPPLAIGKPAPAVTAGAFRPADARGTPVVLVFFMPGQPTADLSLAVADALQMRYGRRLVVAPLAVFAPAALGLADRDRLKLTVPVYDGTAAGEAFGVDTFPRFVLLDRGGVVRWAFAGVGAETGFLLKEQVDALLNPPAGTGSPPAPTRPAAGPQR